MRRSAHNNDIITWQQVCSTFTLLLLLRADFPARRSSPFPFCLSRYRVHDEHKARQHAIASMKLCIYEKMCESFAIFTAHAASLVPFASDSFHY